MNKSEIFQLVKKQMQDDLDVAVQELAHSREVATSTENKADEDDAGNLEASYLESAQSKRLLEIKNGLGILNGLKIREFKAKDLITVTALVKLTWDKKEFYYFILPESGGLKIDYRNKEIMLITPQSPLGRELLGKKIGETIEVGTPNSTREYEIKAVY
ncbi:MAG: GreA/GreB family elongation factor [Pseudomonadota bacterium]